MGYTDRFQFTVTSEARFAMDRLGVSDPVAAFREFDFDVDGYQHKLAQIKQTASSLELASGTLPAAPTTWTGAGMVSWGECENKFIAVLMILRDFALWFVSALIWFLDVIVELIRWLATVVDEILAWLSAIGLILQALEHFGVRIPAWVRQVMRLLKLVEKGVKIVLLIVSIAAFLLARFATYIDQGLDWLRETIEDYRLSIAGCITPGERIEDEPIEPPTMPWER